jgi:hypothetical protein
MPMTEKGVNDRQHSSSSERNNESLPIWTKWQIVLQFPALSLTSRLETLGKKIGHQNKWTLKRS